MADWDITATTVFCEDVGDEVTFIVYKDGIVKCTGRDKYEKPDNNVKKTLGKKSRSSGKQLACRGEDCVTVKQYRDKVIGEK